MSGTLNNIYSDVSFAVHLHTEAIARLQEQASTGSRVNRASDDPSNAHRILGLNSQGRSLENYMDNISEAIDTLDMSHDIILGEEIGGGEGYGGIIPALREAKTLISQVTSGSYGEESRKRTAEAVNNILEHIVSLANTKRVNQYLFGGDDTASAPYVAEYTDGEITSVTYQGSLEDRNIEVAAGVESSAFCVGDNIFRSNDRGDPIFIGDTGAKAGTGTSSVRGAVWLTVTEPVSGTYRLSIDDDPTSYVDVAVPPGSANTMVTHAETGEVLYVDTTGITSTGTDMVSVPGTHDIFNTLITIRDILRNERDLPEAQLQELRENSLTFLDEVSNLLVQGSVSIGAKMGFLENLKNSLENVKYNTEDEVSRLEEADIAQIAIELSRREVLYQMSLSVAARLMSMSLLDFLR